MVSVEFFCISGTGYWFSEWGWGDLERGCFLVSIGKPPCHVTVATNCGQNRQTNYVGLTQW